MDIAKFSVQRPIATTMRLLIFVLMGAIAYTQLSVELLPEVEPPRLFVTTNWPGIAPEDMETQITAVVEDAVATVPGVVTLSSSTSEGSSRVSIEFFPGLDMGQAALDVLQQIQRAQRNFPSDDPTLQAPAIRGFDPNAMPIILIGVSGLADPIRLRTILEEEIKPVLESAPGVGAVEVNGGQEEAVLVEFNSSTLLARSLTSQDLVTALGRENRNAPAGRAFEGDRELLVRSYGWLQDLTELGLIPVGQANGYTIELASVAQISQGHRDVTVLERLNGEAAGSLGIQKQSGANTIETIEGVLEKLEEVRHNYPDLTFEQVYSQADYVGRSVQSLKQAAIMGGILAMGVVLFFLRNLRTTFVVATSIPVSIISTFAFIWWQGYTLNTMTLVALALVTGLVIDDAVVIMENIYRKMEAQDLEPAVAAVEGTRPVVSAVISSTLTVVVVFFPLLLIPGLTGQMFKPFALVVIVAMLISTFDALTSVPMLCSLMIKKPDKTVDPQTASFWHRTSETLKGWFEALDLSYQDYLQGALQRPRAVLGMGLAVTVLSLLLLPLVGYDFMPRTDTGTLRMRATMPRGTSLEETNREVRKLEQVLAEHPDITTYMVRIGQGFGATAARDTAQAWMALTDRRQRASADAIAAELGGQFSQASSIRAFPTSMDIVRRVLTIGGSDAGLEINIFGPDLMVLERLSNQFLDVLRPIPGCQDLANDAGDLAPEIRWIVDRAKAAKLGVSFSDVATAIQTAAEGTVASFMQVGGRRIPIVVQMAPDQRRTTNQLRDLIVGRIDNGQLGETRPGTSAGAAQGVQLNQVARAENALGYPTITRLSRQRYASLSGAGEGRPISEIQADVQAALAEIDLPDGYRWDWSEGMKAQGQEFRKLAFSIILAVILVYMLLAIQFEDLFIPLSIILSVPLCIVGVILALFLTNTPFSIMAGVGCLLLIGIAVKNGILLIENTLQAREAGRERTDALLYACPERLRPILITAFSAILCMVPVAIKGELEGPMAVAVIGGLLASTLLTLFIVPAAYILLDDLRSRFLTRSSRV